MREKKSIPAKTRKTFAIVVDGQCEVWYMQMIKRNERKIPVNIEPKLPQKKSISEQYEMVKRLLEDYFKVFWIVDFDTVLLETKQAKRGAKTCLQYFDKYYKEFQTENSNVVVIINNPCIEYWFLQHFFKTSKYFVGCKAAEKQLKTYIDDYEKKEDFFTKQGKDIYLILKDKRLTAISNSKFLKPFDVNEPDNGMAEMFLFFEDKDFEEYFVEN